MIRSLLTVALSAVLLLGCPKNTGGTSTLGGSDDEKMDMIAAKLEELRTSTEDCKEQCKLKPKVCELSSTACEIAGRFADRSDYQKRCITAQEECARYNEACSGCAK